MNERFTLLEELGAGGMGIVWKARDNESNEIVALKLVHPHLAKDPDYVARFEREVDVARRIDSPNVVKVLGYGTRDGVPFMSMEYVEGNSMRDLLRERGKLPWKEAKPIVWQVAEGLAAAHAAGVIHRDVKPSNILITPDGTAKLADFGIARALDMTRLTGSSTMLGTPHYMAPDTETTAESDLYSLGCVLFEILAGRPPFEGDTQQQVIAKHFRADPDLSAVRELEARDLLADLLDKTPGHRGRLLLSDETRSRRAPVPTSTDSRRWGLAVVVVVVGMMVVFGGSWAAFAAISEDRKADNEPVLSAGGEDRTGEPSHTATRLPATVEATVVPEWSATDVWEWPDAMFAGPVCGVRVTLDDPDGSCMAGFMREHGASDRAISFYEATGLFLSSFEELGAIDYGRSAAPWFNMGRPTPHLLLNGAPEVLDITGPPDDWDNDPSYLEFESAYPGAFPFWEYGELQRAEALTGGSFEFVIEYPLRTCRACPDVAHLTVSTEVDPLGVLAPRKALLNVSIDTY